MHVAFVTFPTPWQILRSSLNTEVPFYGLGLEEKANEVLAKHSLSYWPRKMDIDWMIDQVLLSTDYVVTCQKRIEKSEALKEQEEMVVIGNLLAPLAPSWVTRSRKLLQEENTDLTRALTELLSLYKRLETFHSACDYQRQSKFPPKDLLSVHEIVAKAEELWPVENWFYPPNYADELAAAKPDFVFFEGEFPATLKPAIVLRQQLTQRLPLTRFFLWPEGTSLYESFAFQKQALLDSRLLFELFEGVPIYLDFLWPTFVELVKRMEHGLGYDQLENFAYADGGKVCFHEPSSKSIERFLKEAKLTSFPPWRTFGHDSQEGRNQGQQVRASGILHPAIALCYWNRCTFCGSNRQLCISQDPFLEKRAKDAARCMEAMARKGVDYTFIGHIAMHPSILDNICNELLKKPDPPFWAFEGKIDPAYNQKFIQKLAKAGCRGVIFGLETASDELNQKMNKHVTGVNLARIERMIDDFDSAGISVHVNTICDFPGSSKADFENYVSWLHRMFDSHKFFQFNTNEFFLAPGSILAQDPARVGLEALAKPYADNFLVQRIPFRKTDPDSFDVPVDEIWRSIFGAPNYKGIPFNELHNELHEQTGLVFRDAIEGKNFFKNIQMELSLYNKLEELRLNMPGGIHRITDDHSTVDDDPTQISMTWLIDLKREGFWLSMPTLFWQVIESAITTGKTVGEVIKESSYFIKNQSKRKECLQTIGDCLMLGLLLNKTQ